EVIELARDLAHEVLDRERGLGVGAVDDVRLRVCESGGSVEGESENECNAFQDLTSNFNVALIPSRVRSRSSISCATSFLPRGRSASSPAARTGSSGVPRSASP